MTTIKKNYRLMTMFALLVAFIAIILFSTLNFVNADEKVVKEDEINIAHITDSHYFAYEDCYLGTDEEVYKNTDFYRAESKDTKLLKQSGTLINATIKNILVQKPDYLVISGDITSNGEITGHMDVANALRYLQNEMRKFPGKENFQIFVTPGNHDIYNNRAAKYINDDEASETLAKGSKFTSPDFITTAEAFRVIYNGLGYPYLNLTELNASSVGAYMLEYFNSESTNPIAYTSEYVSSQTASNVEIKYYSTLNPTKDDRMVGCLTYVANVLDKNYGFVMVDATERDAISKSVNTKTNEEIYWNQATGGQVPELVKKWIVNNTENLRSENKTIIGSTHFNVVPHFSMEENYTKDFTLYNWEDAAQFFADEVGIRYFYTGHMHSSDRAQFVSYNGNVLQDFETGSLVSLNPPTRFTRIVRYKQNDKVLEDAYTAVTRLNSLKGIKSVRINENGAPADTIKFDDLDDLVKVIDEVLYDQLVTRMLGGYLNESLEATLINLVNGLDVSSIPVIGGFGTAINQLAKAVIHQLIYDLDYNIDGIQADNLYDFVKAAVYKTDTLKMVVYEENGEVFTLEDVLLSAYKGHLAGNEPQQFDSSTVYGRACIAADEGFLDGSLVKKLLNGLLKPLLYEDNSVLKQLLSYKFDVTSCTDANFNSLVSLFIDSNSTMHPKNNGGTLAINDLLKIEKTKTVYIALMKLLPSNIATLVDEALEMGVANWAEDQLDKYMTESFFTAIGGILSQSYKSFAIDETYDGPSYIVDGLALSQDKWTKVSYNVEGYSDYTYNGTALTLEQNKPTYEDGRLPSHLTSTFGDDAATSQNFKWYTNYRIGGKFLYREAGTQDFIEATVTTKIEPVAVPLIDLGLFATTTKVEDDNDVKLTFETREAAGLHSSVKFAAIHEVSLTNLKPGTEYEYKVIGTYNAQEFVASDKPYSFKTALGEDDAPFTFMAISDIQGTIKSSYELALSALEAAKDKIDYSFIVNCGDVVDNAKNIKQWSYAFNVLSPIFANTSTVVAAGNHEKSSGALASYYNFGGIGNSSSQKFDSGVYYSFNYGRVHFVVLNTNDLDAKGGLSKAQTKWLTEDLKAANENEKTNRIIVAMHKSLYSIGSHVEDSDVIALREQLVPLFADNNVDLVLAGHDHTFSTTQILDREGNVVDKVKKTKNGFKINHGEGVVYMTLGTISDKYYEYRQVESTEELLNKKYTIFGQIDAPMFTGITVGLDGIEVNTYAYQNGKVVTLSQYKNYVEQKPNVALILSSIAVAIALAVVTYFLVIAKNYNKN